MTGNRPNVWLIGDTEHRDFAESMALLRSSANFHPGPPELIVLVQSRPGTIRRIEFDRMRRSMPLAGVVTLCGSWCEGEPRTGRPLAGATRLYWYEFPNWWRRQLSQLAAGRCPEWAQVSDCESRMSDFGSAEGGRVVVAADNWETVVAIADVLETLRLKTEWIRSGMLIPVPDNLVGAIWDGGQLSDDELKRLADFCMRMKVSAVPVIALLDFPRHDRCEVARQAGAVAVLGKPWLSADLLTEVGRAMELNRSSNIAPISRAA